MTLLRMSEVIQAVTGIPLSKRIAKLVDRAESRLRASRARIAGATGSPGLASFRIRPLKTLLERREAITSTITSAADAVRQTRGR